MSEEGRACDAYILDLQNDLEQPPRKAKNMNAVWVWRDYSLYHRRCTP